MREHSNLFASVLYGPLFCTQISWPLVTVATTIIFKVTVPLQLHRDGVAEVKLGYSNYNFTFLASIGINLYGSVLSASPLSGQSFFD